MSIKVMVYYLDNSPLMGNDKLAMVILADYASDEGECFPGHKRVAQRLNMTVSGARKILYKLRDAGELQIDNGDGIKTKMGQHTNRYHLLAYQKSLSPSGECPTQDSRECPVQDSPLPKGVSPASDTDPSVSLTVSSNRQLKRVASATPSPSCDEKDSSVSVKEKQFIPPPVADTPPKELTEQQEWFGVACAIVGWDYQTLPQKERAQVAQTLGIIRKAGYTLEELKQFLPQVWYKDWRWVKNQSFPTLSQLKTEIGKVRAQPQATKNFVAPKPQEEGVYGKFTSFTR